MIATGITKLVFNLAILNIVKILISLDAIVLNLLSRLVLLAFLRVAHKISLHHLECSLNADLVGSVFLAAVLDVVHEAHLLHLGRVFGSQVGNDFLDVILDLLYFFLLALVFV
jgi:hypothetical protein